MANTTLTPDMITFKCLDILEMASPFIRNINRQYDDKFANNGAKIGDALRIRKPERALVTKGATLQADESTEEYTTLTITDQDHIGLNFTTAELALDIDDFAERKLKPRISQLAASIESAIAQQFYRDVWQSVGTPGTTPNTALMLLQGQQKLQEMNAPMDNVNLIVNPAANSALVDAMKGYFHSGDKISSQFKSGLMGNNVLGYNEIAMGQGVYSHTRGTSPTSPIVATTVATQGQATLDISFTSGSPTFKRGDVFTIATVYAVNPQTRVSTGSLQQFVVTADVTVSSTTTATLAIQPPIYTAEHKLATVNEFPASSDALTFLGSSSGVYPQNMVFQKNACTLATADLVLPNGVDFASRQNYKGISMRIVKQYDINNDRLPCRVDVLYGIKVVRPELACRLWG